MTQALTMETGEIARVWGPVGGLGDGPDGAAPSGYGPFSSRSLRERQRRPVSPRPMAFNAWLSAEDLAVLILRGECAAAGISVPARFAPPAIASALSSIERWTREGRIFAIHDLYPRYQFDGRGRPHPPVERALAVFGREAALRVGNWFAAPNPDLGGKRPQELLATAPMFVVLALQKIAPQNDQAGVPALAAN